MQSQPSTFAKKQTIIARIMWSWCRLEQRRQKRTQRPQNQNKNTMECPPIFVKNKHFHVASPSGSSSRAARKPNTYLTCTFCPSKRAYAGFHLDSRCVRSCINCDEESLGFRNHVGLMLGRGSRVQGLGRRMGCDEESLALRNLGLGLEVVSRRVRIQGFGTRQLSG